MTLTREQVLFAADVAEQYPAGMDLRARGHDGHGNGVIMTDPDALREDFSLVPKGCG